MLNQKPETGNMKPETGNMKLTTAYETVAKR